MAFGLPVLLLMAIGVSSYFAFLLPGEPPKPKTLAAPPFPKTTRKAKSLNELLEMPPERLADVDIGEMNLLCATGLPGAENLDIDHCLATLDQWAARVKFETGRHLYRAHDPRWAEHYRHSECHLRAEFLLQVLQEDLGVRYDMTAADNFDFDNSRVAFIHGMIPAPGRTIDQTPGGTCASMPVMYVTVGRRLGYPLKLVTTNAHVFVRWDGREHPNPAWRERFNIEGTDGFGSYPDSYYKTWPFRITDHQVRVNGFLVSLTPMEEFAMFLASRGHCGVDNNQPAFAARCYENASRYDKRRPCYRAWFVDAALRSGYRPFTPALAAALARRKQSRRLVARRPMVDAGIPMPSAAAAAAAKHGLLGGPAPSPINTWRPRPQPLIPTVPQPHTPKRPESDFAQPHQPPAPGQPPR